MRALRWVSAAVVLTSVLGCGSKTGDVAALDPTSATPQAAVKTFLTAVKAGDDASAEKMLTPLTIESIRKYEITVAPPGSDTASFEVGEVEMVAEDGAHVASRWTDVDDQGQPHSDNIVWMVRKEEQGWRIAGMAAVVFPGEPPVFLNFEDPEDMMRKQQLIVEEMERREAAAGSGNLAAPTTTADPAATTTAPEATAPRQAQQPAAEPGRRQ